MNLAVTQDGLRNRPRRARRVLLWRWIAGLVIAILAAAGFLFWGPIGLGSGPLTVDLPDGGQILGPQGRAWGMMVGVQAGNSGAVVDQVTVVGAAGYGAPRVLSAYETPFRPGQCGGAFPWTGLVSVVSTCATSGLHRLIGLPLPGGNPGPDMVIKVGAPVSPRQCWIATAIVVRYHVGIRHYTVTSTGDFAACKTAREEHQADLALGQSD